MPMSDSTSSGAPTPTSNQVPVEAPDGTPDAGIPWHYGDPHAEQRALVAGDAVVDLSNRGVVQVSGPDRLGWLNNLVSHKVDDLPADGSSLALILDPHGHVEHELHIVDDGSLTWITVEPGTSATLTAYLDSMRFMRRVEVCDVTGEFAVVWHSKRDTDTAHITWLPPAEFAGVGVTPSGEDRGGGADRYVKVRPGVFVGCEVIIPRDQLAEHLQNAPSLAGTWAREAVRVSAGVPRLGLDTDHKTLPHEVGWIGTGVHLAKGCYRGQETVARVHNLGRPPRRLVLLHLDGSVEELPEHGANVMVGERVVGQVGTAVRHYELGPIATAIIKRNTSIDGPLAVALPGETGAVVAASAEDVVVAG